jgi:hypothetical protein
MTQIHWKPGVATGGDGVDGGQHYATFDECFAIARRTEGDVEIVCDASVAACNVSAADLSGWDMGGRIWLVGAPRAAGSRSLAIVTLAATGRFIDLPGFRDIELDLPVGGLVYTNKDKLAISNGTMSAMGATAALVLTGTRAVEMWLKDGSQITAAGTSAIACNGTSELALHVDATSSVATDSISGAAGATLTAKCEATLNAQSGFLGTVTIAESSGGTTAHRPASPFLGQMYFDTTIATPIPIWWDGAQWVDSAGAPA